MAEGNKALAYAVIAITVVAVAAIGKYSFFPTMNVNTISIRENIKRIE